jgi:hypothetical protein
MRVILYTPTYYASPGTQARVDLVKKSLEIAGHKTTLIIDRESQLQSIYHALGERLLTLETVWKVMGRLISRSICKQRPKAVILFIDISASAIPYLKKNGISTILSIEDLTPEYKNYDFKASEKFYQILGKYADQADTIISSSYTLSKRLKHIGLKVIPVPIGLESYISIEEALSRIYSPFILHAGRINLQRQIEVILNLADKYRLMIHNTGELADKISHPHVEKYRESTLEKAVLIARRANMGLIVEYRKAYTLSRLYFHLSLLQPIIAEGRGPWVEEANYLGIKLHQLSAVEEIIENYERYVRKCAEAQEGLIIPNVHKQLLSLLE